MSLSSKSAKFVLERVDSVKKAVDDERGIMIIIDRIHQLYHKYGLVGEIEIERGTMFPSSLTCEIDGTGEYVPDPVPKTAKVCEFVDNLVYHVIKLIIKGVDKLLNDLIHRSKQFWHKSYKEGMTLSGSFTFSDPKQVFNMTITCGASVASMHDILFQENVFENTYGFPADAV